MQPDDERIAELERRVDAAAGVAQRSLEASAVWCLEHQVDRGGAGELTVGSELEAAVVIADHGGLECAEETHPCPGERGVGSNDPSDDS